MNTPLKRFTVVGLCAFVLFSLLTFLYRREHRVVFQVPPLPKVVPQLTTVEAEEILGANFKIIDRIQQVPTAVMDDYTAITHQPFRMVNAGEPVSTDAIIPGVPNKRLVLVGLADQSEVLIFHRYGLMGTAQAMVFSHKGTGGAWEARLEESSVNDIAGLRAALHNGRFERW